jgi:hypothetical protein
MIEAGGSIKNDEDDADEVAVEEPPEMPTLRAIPCVPESGSPVDIICGAQL